jgi:hypothetical protein
MTGWEQFLKTLLGSLAGLLAVAFGFILLMNPYGHLPWNLLGRHAIMDINQRYQYPAIARSGDFDSAVFGTSTARLLDPDYLDGQLGGRFANLAMNDARPWEQYRLALLFLQHQPGLRTLIVGLDWNWCEETADVNRITTRGFPEWLYDDTRWNDWYFLFNPRTLEFAGRLAAHRLGIKPARIPFNGFEVFVPPESAYDPVKVEKLLWAGGAKEVKPRVPAYAVTAEDLRAWRFPALPWLEEILAATPADARRILAFMPVHVSRQPAPGSEGAARERLCKARVADIAGRHQAVVIDFGIASGITTRDANYWDTMHYRLPIAYRIVDGIARAVTTRADDPAGDWVMLGRRTSASQ